MLASVASFAQKNNDGMRRHVQNVTDYSLLEKSLNMNGSAVHRIGSRATAPLACMGSPKIPVVLVQFDDLKFISAESDSLVNEVFHKTFNGSGIPGVPHRVSGVMYGAVSDYFIEQSDSLFMPEFTVLGPVTLSQGYAYYGGNGNGREGADINISAFYSEACKLAIEGNDVTWEDFDNNSDGKVDFVFFIYAGYGENDSSHDDPNTIWPKESVSSLNVTVEGKTITFGAYGCTNEVYNGHQDGIGTIVHEISHGLGLPDLYNTSNSGTSFGMDMFDVMDSGNYQSQGTMPCCYSTYERDFMGWRSLEVLSADTVLTLTIEPLETGGKGYKIANPANENEYFVLENRQNLGFDYRYGIHSGNSEVNKYGTCHGLLITHVDYTSSSWSSNRVNTITSHQRLTPVPADGKLSLVADADYYTSLRKDLYPTGGDSLSSDAVFTGGNMGITITDIVENEDLTITLKINSRTPDDNPDAIDSVHPGAAVVETYTLSGVKIKGMQKGINIVRMSDGSVRKVSF